MRINRSSEHGQSASNLAWPLILLRRRRRCVAAGGGRAASSARLSAQAERLCCTKSPRAAAAAAPPPAEPLAALAQQLYGADYRPCRQAGCAAPCAAAVRSTDWPGRPELRAPFGLDALLGPGVGGGGAEEEIRLAMVFLKARATSFAAAWSDMNRYNMIRSDTIRSHPIIVQVMSHKI